jgi:hypothetical protein
MASLLLSHPNAAAVLAASATLTEKARAWLDASREVKAQAKELLVRRKAVKKLEQALSVLMCDLHCEAVAVSCADGSEVVVRRTQALQVAKDGALAVGAAPDEDEGGDGVGGMDE